MTVAMYARVSSESQSADQEQEQAARARLTAVRDTSRDSSSESRALSCPVCSGPLPSSRARYCSPAHRQRAFRLRHVERASIDERQLRAELRRRQALVAHTVYECSVCGERSVGEKRCQDCHLFSRAVGLGGHCAECDQPILLTELLELEVPQ